MFSDVVSIVFHCIFDDYFNVNDKYDLLPSATLHSRSEWDSAISTSNFSICSQIFLAETTTISAIRWWNISWFIWRIWRFKIRDSKNQKWLEKFSQSKSGSYRGSFFWEESLRRIRKWGELSKNTEEIKNRISVPLRTIGIDERAEQNSWRAKIHVRQDEGWRTDSRIWRWVEIRCVDRW